MCENFCIVLLESTVLGYMHGRECMRLYDKHPVCELRRKISSMEVNATQAVAEQEV